MTSALYIVNNYPMTKNKQIYHVRISKQMKGASFQRALSSAYSPSVINRFIFGHGVVIHFIMQRKPTNFAKNSPDERRFAFRHFVYLVNSSAITPQNDSSKFATITVDFVDNLIFSCLLFHLRNVA